MLVRSVAVEIGPNEAIVVGRVDLVRAVAPVVLAKVDVNTSGVRRSASFASRRSKQ